ncbi:AraC-like ligand-binding domain-containing protein [Streptomyces sp. NPDC003393]
MTVNHVAASRFVIKLGPQVHLDSLESVSERCAPAFYSHTVQQLTAEQRPEVDYQIMQIGPITVSDVTYGADVRLDFGELGTAFHVNLPLSGKLESRNGDVCVTADPEIAAVFGPQGDTVITRWAAGSRNVSVKIDRGVVTGTLADVLRDDVPSTLALAPSIDLRTGGGRSWTRLVRLLVEQLDDPQSVLREPMTAMPFAESIVNGFLMVASPAYRQALDRPAGHIRPAAVRAAVDIIHAEASEPLTTDTLARRCHVSARTLQENFQRHVGLSPMAYLRSIRLERAHAELRAADPSRDTVTAIAHRWGFSNVSRFAHLHRVAFGESPVETLRGRFFRR